VYRALSKLCHRSCRALSCTYPRLCTHTCILSELEVLKLARGRAVAHAVDGLEHTHTAVRFSAETREWQVGLTVARGGGDTRRAGMERGTLVGKTIPGKGEMVRDTRGTGKAGDTRGRERSTRGKGKVGVLEPLRLHMCACLSACVCLCACKCMTVRAKVYVCIYRPTDGVGVYYMCAGRFDEMIRKCERGDTAAVTAYFQENGSADLPRSSRFHVSRVYTTLLYTWNVGYKRMHESNCTQRSVWVSMRLCMHYNHTPRSDYVRSRIGPLLWLLSFHEQKGVSDCISFFVC
jgi:hypothetical protein